MSRRASTRPVRTYCYARCSTSEQARSGLGIAAQRAELLAEVTRRGAADVAWVIDEGVSGSTLARPGLERILADAGRGDVVIATKGDRVSRRLSDLLALLERARQGGWSLVLLDLQVDTATPTGAFLTQSMGAVAELERRLIAARTSAALQAAKARGQRLGQGRRTMPRQVLARIVAERDAGASLTAIADRLTADGVPTARGGARWYPSTIAAALDTHRLDVEAHEAAHAAQEVA